MLAVYPSGGRDALVADDQRYAGRFVVEHGFVLQPVGTVHVAMVAREYYQGVVFDLRFMQCIKQYPYLFVNHFGQTTV